MYPNKLALAALGAAILAGCVYVPLGKVPKLTAGTVAAAGHASLVLQPRLQEGGYRVQATVLPYARADVQHLVLALFKVDGGSESAIVDPTGTPIVKDLAGAAIDGAVTFSNLHPNTTYRVHAFAFQAAGTASTDVISENASSTLLVRVETDDRPQTGVLDVALKDRPFAAEATTSVHILPGTYVTDPEGIR